MGVKKKPRQTGRRQGNTAKAMTRTKKRTAVAGVALSNTVGVKRTRKPELQYIPWDTVPIEPLNPLLGRQFVVGQEIMVARVLMKKGCLVPLHSHFNEQITYILEGALKFWIDGKEIVVHAGEVLTIPPHMPHKAEALEDTVDLDVFNPPRHDSTSGTDAYIRR
jgi:quercetin dioxygenase-like cupin family protein